MTIGLAAPTVLVVEDDAEVSHVVSGLLDGAGYNSVTIADHDDIAAAIERWQPKCVILDGELLPRGQERSWDDAIAVRRAHPELPVLMFTADTGAVAEALDGTSGRSLAAGFAGVIAKPFAVDQFLATVRSAVEAPALPASTTVLADAPILAIALFPEVGPPTEDTTQVAFLNTVVHELRTPLTSISGQIQLARRNVLLLDPRRLTLALDRALVQVARMEGLIDELLDRSRIAAGALTLEIATFDLTAVVADVVAQHEVGEIPRIYFDPPDEHIRVRGDASRVGQIAGNLVVNALRYGLAGSPIELSLEVVGTEARLLVEDRGVGVPAEEHEKIFEPYYRSTRTRTVPGTGLGLHISRRLAERHGGRLWLERSTDAGSAFVLALPIAQGTDGDDGTVMPTERPTATMAAYERRR